MQRTHLITLTILLAGLAAGSEQEVRQAEQNWASAVAAGNHGVLQELLHDELIYGHSSGVVETKGEYLGKMKTGAQTYSAIEHRNMTVKTFGDSAVVHATVRMKGTSGGRPFDNELLMLHVWVRQGGKWRLAAHQTARPPQP